MVYNTDRNGTFSDIKTIYDSGDVFRFRSAYGADIDGDGDMDVVSSGD